jgi:hypothetical protein
MNTLAGKTVASVRRSLATVFSIPDDAEVWTGEKTPPSQSGRAS